MSKNHKYSKRRSIRHQMFLAILALWLALAMGSLNLDDKQINLLHKHLFIRLIVIFIFSMTVLDLEEDKLTMRIILSLILTLVYYILGEL